MGARILNGAVIGANCLVGAGALVTEGKVFEPGMLIVGVAGAGRSRADRGGDCSARRCPPRIMREKAAHYAREVAVTSLTLESAGATAPSSGP